MAVGKRPEARQGEMFVVASEIRALDNPFYWALNELLAKSGFDEFAEEACREFYADNRGRPGIAPGVYFRMMMVGYLEGIGSERGIAWRCGDSLSLREFLGYGWAKNPPEHSTLSKTRKRLSVEAHAAVFGRVLELLKGSGLLSGKTLGVDSTTLEANAAMRTIVRRDDGLGYDEWLQQVARASGIETPTRKDLTTLDRKRPKKGSNKDWVHPHDPEARITKMKDGRTRLAHKLEQAVDMETGALVAVTVQTMDGGDVASLPNTLDEAERQLEVVQAHLCGHRDRRGGDDPRGPPSSASPDRGLPPFAAHRLRTLAPKRLSPKRVWHASEKLIQGRMRFGRRAHNNVRRPPNHRSNHHRRCAIPTGERSAPRQTRSSRRQGRVDVQPNDNRDLLARLASEPRQGAVHDYMRNVYALRGKAHGATPSGMAGLEFVRHP